MAKQRMVALIECTTKSEGQDARMLAELLKMIKFRYDKIRCKDKEQLVEALDQPARYFHISAHGNGKSLYVNDDPVSPDSLGCSLRGSFVTLSACATISATFVTRLHKSTKVSAVVSPLATVGFGESALFATLFYFSLAQAPKLSAISRRGDADEARLPSRLAQYIDAFQKSKHAYSHAGGTGAHRLFYWYGGQSVVVT